LSKCEPGTERETTAEDDRSASAHAIDRGGDSAVGVAGEGSRAGELVRLPIAPSTFRGYPSCHPDNHETGRMPPPDHAENFGLAGMRSGGEAWDPDAMALRCLLVDDSARFLRAASALLEREGVAVVGVAKTSAEALQHMEELRPDVVLLDINLGSDSGFELARHVEARARTTQDSVPRVILISSHAREDFEDLIAASPAVGFLDKSAVSARAIRDLLGTGCARDCQS
jgi:two-component system, NarL family, nitrate/nitrite response regulator NarL